MAKFISINVIDNTNSGVGGASQFGEGEHLINVDKIIEVTQTDVSTLTVLLDSPVGAADIVTLVASIKDSGAATGAGNIPVTPIGAPLKEALNYSLTANPGGVKSKCILGFDQATPKNRMYWRSFVQA
jgi:hypothetical protein